MSGGNPDFEPWLVCTRNLQKLVGFCESRGQSLIEALML